MTKAIDFRYECKIIVINEKQIMKIVNIFVALFCLTACSLSNGLKDRLILKPQSILIDPDKVKDFIDLTPLLRDSVEMSVCYPKLNGLNSIKIVYLYLIELAKEFTCLINPGDLSVRLVVKEVVRENLPLLDSFVLQEILF